MQCISECTYHLQVEGDAAAVVRRNVRDIGRAGANRAEAGSTKERNDFHGALPHKLFVRLVQRSSGRGNAAHHWVIFCDPGVRGALGAVKRGKHLRRKAVERGVEGEERNINISSRCHLIYPIEAIIQLFFFFFFT